MKKSFFLSAGLAAMCFATGLSAVQLAHAQESSVRDINSIVCRDIVRMSGDDRDIAMAFLHGYVLGTSGNGEFEVEVLYAASDSFIEHCLDNPDDVAVDVLREAVGS